MADDNKLFSFQGYVYLGDLSGRKIANPFWVGDATMNIALETESVEHTESFSGQRLPYGRLTTKKSATATLTLFEARAENLALALYGNKVTVTAGTVTGEALPTAAAGDLFALDHALVSALTISDSASDTLAEGEDFSIENAAGGLVKILNVTGFTQPFKAAYSHATVDSTGLFTVTPPERFVKMVGVNTLDNTPVIVDLYRVRFDPASELSLHNEEFGSFELSGALLAVAGLMNSPLGGFGSITLGNNG
ncbi:MAG: hypothetical protein LBI92_06855 [Azoarcus sp.]|jgi:hypothetical protein|nr:hypothetical protein [Azoarcus sp.]